MYIHIYSYMPAAILPLLCPLLQVDGFGPDSSDARASRCGSSLLVGSFPRT